jgi:hypothetical protein
MPRKESPENQLAAIAAAAAISLVLVQTLSDRVPLHVHSRPSAAEPCTRPILARNTETMRAPTASGVRANCLSREKHGATGSDAAKPFEVSTYFAR